MRRENINLVGERLYILPFKAFFGRQVSIMYDNFMEYRLAKLAASYDDQA